jgi:hypothetical protein
MCCFSVPPVARPVGWLARLFAPRPPKLHVSGTRIFARVEPNARTQWLAYSMALATSSDVAMMLPLPVARVADDALSFVDLSGYENLFDDLATLFLPPAPVPSAARSQGAPKSRAPRPKLVVHEVGSFEASYVPSLADMGRLDERFRIPELVWRRRPEYERFGFAVFKLKKGGKKTIHPMAMRFETAEPGALFFPTVHVHDGEMHDDARFDHTLYFQVGDGDALAPRGPDGAAVFAREAMLGLGERLVARSKGLLVPGGKIFALDFHGRLANGDVRVALSSPAEAAA